MLAVKWFTLGSKSKYWISNIANNAIASLKKSHAVSNHRCIL